MSARTYTAVPDNGTITSVYDDATDICIGLVVDGGAGVPLVRFAVYCGAPDARRCVGYQRDRSAAVAEIIADWRVSRDARRVCGVSP